MQTAFSITVYRASTELFFCLHKYLEVLMISELLYLILVFALLVVSADFASCDNGVAVGGEL